KTAIALDQARRTLAAGVEVDWAAGDEVYGRSTSGPLTIPVEGNAISGQGHLEFNPTTLSFGTVVRGTSKTRTFTITNTGNIPVTVTKAKAPAGAFSSADPLPEGLVIGPEQSVRQTVTFAPTVSGSQSATYEVTGDAGQGAQLEQLTDIGVPPASQLGTLLARDYSGTLWQYHGTGVLSAPLASRAAIGPGWNTYNIITSVSGEMADGTGTAVGRDSKGTLWFYQGTGNPNAPFGPRKQVGPGWNIYNPVVGAGDVTGDGKADLVARDSKGGLWLYRGTGNATAPFLARTFIGPNWNIYNSLI
ncbi:choice-of-anchor D domain-containing protein, partial [Streptomyces sp. NPDC001978]|uniref:choice-of-anchor D domain-containing protein n=1 Tax=Streptomyces sp. NPDC001978 TaxID=3364627 RepID=UPI00369B1EBA